MSKKSVEDEKKEMDVEIVDTITSGGKSVKDGKTAEEKKVNVKREIISWVIVIAAAFALAYIITHFIIIKAEVPTSSMENTVMTGDKIVGNRLSYLFSDPERGDIVLFYQPDTVAAGADELYIKRVIGLPGDTIEIKDSMLYINGEAYPEDYLKETMDSIDYGPYEVPEGSYFMMGDNRNVSYDARKWSIKYVSKDLIIGKAWFRYKPSLGLIG